MSATYGAGQRAPVVLLGNPSQAVVVAARGFSKAAEGAPRAQVR